MSFNPVEFLMAGSAKVFGSSFANNEFASWDKHRKVEVFDLVMHSSYMTSRFWQVSFDARMFQNTLRPQSLHPTLDLGVLPPVVRFRSRLNTASQLLSQVFGILIGGGTASLGLTPFMSPTGAAVSPWPQGLNRLMINPWESQAYSQAASSNDRLGALVHNVDH
jgi:hypothetical protein